MNVLSHYSKLTEIIIVYHSVKMNSQNDSTNEQTSRSLVEDTRVQSSTNGVGPSTGLEGRRDGAASPGTSGSSDAEMQKRLKAVKLSEMDPDHGDDDQDDKDEEEEGEM